MILVFSLSFPRICGFGSERKSLVNLRFFLGKTEKTRNGRTGFSPGKEAPDSNSLYRGIANYYRGIANYYCSSDLLPVVFLVPLVLWDQPRIKTLPSSLATAIAAPKRVAQRNPKNTKHTKNSKSLRR